MPEQTNQASNNARSWATYLSAAASTLATVALAPAGGKAALITVTNRPISMSPTAAQGAQALWDVDGTGGNEFRLWNTSGIGGPFKVYLGSFPSSTGQQFKGRGLVGPTAGSSEVKALASSYNVGPANIWGRQNFNYRQLMLNNGAIGNDFDQFFTQGDNYFGFRFDKAGSMYYGYGVLNIDSAGKTVTISRWAYSDVANVAVHVEPISAAAVPGPIGLAGLAAGAAWTRKLRRRIRESA